MKRLHSLLVLAVFVSLAVPNAAWAVSYTFTKIADNTGEFAQFRVPFLNNNGTVAFTGILDNGDEGVFTGHGGPLTTIAISSFNDFNPPTINNRGQVAFMLREDNSGAGIGVFVGDGGSLIPIADSSGPLGDMNSVPYINNRGDVVFWSKLDAGGEGIFLGNTNGGPLVTITDTQSEPDNTLGSAPSINASGGIAYTKHFGLPINSDGLFLSKNGNVTTLVDPFSGFNVFSNSGTMINDPGTTVFHAASLGSNLPGVYTADANGITPVALNDPAAMLLNPRTPAINNRGTVAFVADFQGNPGLFVGPDPVEDQVISVGDTLDGQKVIGIDFLRGMNDRGQLAFTAILENNRQGVFVANPVPEASTIVLLGIGLVVLSIWRWKKSKPAAQFQ